MFFLLPSSHVSCAQLSSSAKTNRKYREFMAPFIEWLKIDGAALPWIRFIFLQKDRNRKGEQILFLQHLVFAGTLLIKLWPPSNAVQFRL